MTATENAEEIAVEYRLPAPQYEGELAAHRVGRLLSDVCGFDEVGNINRPANEFLSAVLTMYQQWSTAYAAVEVLTFDGEPTEEQRAAGRYTHQERAQHALAELRQLEG